MAKSFDRPEGAPLFVVRLNDNGIKLSGRKSGCTRWAPAYFSKNVVWGGVPRHKATWLTKADAEKVASTLRGKKSMHQARSGVKDLFWLHDPQVAVPMKSEESMDEAFSELLDLIAELERTGQGREVIRDLKCAECVETDEDWAGNLDEAVSKLSKLNTKNALKLRARIIEIKEMR